MCLHNACLTVKAHFWNFNKMITARLVAVPVYNLTVVGNASGKFIVMPTVYVGPFNDPKNK